MAQYNTFFVPHGDTGTQQETLNAFLRAHRVLKVEKSVFPEGWAFCVEWMDGAAGGVVVSRRLSNAIVGNRWQSTAI